MQRKLEQSLKYQLYLAEGSVHELPGGFETNSFSIEI